jgi:glycosyltransferase involved in cell wall biosynthesis
MRIGFDGRVLALSQMRGWTRYTVEILRALSRIETVELVLFCQEPPYPDHLRGIDAEIVALAAPRETIWNDWTLPRAIRRCGVEVFHAPADRGLPAWKPCPLVVTVHSAYERQRWRELYPGAKLKARYWKYELVNYLNADAVITVSRTAAEDLRRAHVARAKTIHPIYPAPSAEFGSQPSGDDEQVLARNGVKRPYVLYVGGYDRHKNVAALVEAFDRSGLAEYGLVVAADHQWEYPRLVSRWRSLSCFDRLRLIEVYPRDLPALYRGAELFVNPSLWESFSFQLVEAMASGTPILSSSRGALPEVAGGAAAFFDPTDVPGLASLLDRISCDEVLKARLRTMGAERVRDFSWERTAEATLAIYREVSRSP